METQAFDTTVGSISFKLLGLWWVVVMGRTAWQVNVARRRMAYAISLHSALPWAMSIVVFFGVQAAWILLIEPLREP